MDQYHATTIVCVRRGAKVALAGDGQVSIGPTIAKDDAVKVRRLEGVGAEGNGVLTGFAGSVADAFTLLERFEGKLKDSPQNLKRAAVELAKLWRSDKVLRRLESMLIVADRSVSLLVSGSGEVIEPSDGVAAIGSGGNFALAAARALVGHTDLSERAIAEESLRIAAGLCVYTNEQITVEELG